MFSTAAALTGFCVLAMAGYSHSRTLPQFSRALRLQRTWPARSVGALAATIAVAEATIGLAGVLLIATSQVNFAEPLLVGLTLVYSLYACYGLFLLRSRPGAPCACTSDLQPIDWLVVARAATLAAVCAAALVGTPAFDGLSTEETIVTVMAAVSFSLIAWAAPAALRDPFLSPAQPGGAHDVV